MRGGERGQRIRPAPPVLQESQFAFLNGSLVPVTCPTMAFRPPAQYIIDMATIRLIGSVDEHHRLSAEVPASISAGSVEVTIVVPQAAGDEDDDAGFAWSAGVVEACADELADASHDIYTMIDGEPLDDRR